MARIKKLKENGATIYPATILDAVVDSKTSTPVTKTRLRYSRASAHGRYYKFMTLERGVEKGIIRFGIESPLMGYADYMVNWTYDTNTEKGMNPYCLFSTNAQMYNRVKLVRTGGSTFDAYFESNAGNDYPAFVFMGEGGTTDSNSITSYIVSIVSAIPEDVYKESDYVGNICFGGIDVYAKNWTALFLKNIDIEAVRTCIDFGGKGFVGYDENSTGFVFGIGGFISPRKSYINVGENGIGYGQGSKIQTIYHAGNLGIATSSKAGLVKGGGDITVDSSGNVTVNQSKALVSRTETDINAEVFKSPGVYVAPISMIDVSGSEIGLYGKSTIITIGNNDNSGYIEQVIITTIDDETKMFFRGWDLTTEAYEFSPLLPDIATSSKAGTVKSGGDISVDSLGNTSVKRNSFNNAGDDAINIDNYPQADYGVIPIWLNTAEADGNPPGREGLVFQAKYRSEQGSSGIEYVDCLTQFYVGNEGVRHRTIVDYDEATKFENTPWSKINDDWYFDLGTATVASSTSSSANVTFTGSSAFSSIRTLLDGLSLATMSNAMPNISLGFSLATGSSITHYIRTKVSSISRLSNGNYVLFAMYQNPLFGDENYVNVLRISITPSSYSCQTLKSL